MNVACVVISVAMLTAIASRRLRSYGISSPSTWTWLALWTTAAGVAAMCARSMDWPGVVLLACAAVCGATDAAEGLIFDRVMLAAALSMVPELFDARHAAVTSIGAFVVGGAIAIPYALTRGRGMGLADVKFAALTGAVLGAYSGLRALEIGCVAGGTVAVALLLAKRARRDDCLPFGSFLAAGTILVTAEVGR